MSKRQHLVPPVTYEDCHECWYLLRQEIFAAAGTKFPPEPEVYDLSERFERDADLRETVCEVLLACTLWIEAGRQCKPLLQNYVPEIKNLLVYGANTFLDFLAIRAAVQKEVVVSRGSLADAWIHLFVEFRDELLGRSNLRWWKRRQFPYGAWQ